MPIPLNDGPTRWYRLEARRPDYHQEVSADGMYAVRVPVAPHGDATEAIRRAQDEARRLLAQQYQPPITQVGNYTIVSGTYYQINAYQPTFADNFRMGNWALPVAPPVPPPETEEQRLERERLEVIQRADREVRQRIARERQERYLAAHDKGMETLRRMLNPKQLKEYDACGAFKVKGSEGNTYEIETTYGYSGNIHWIRAKDGERLASFCCHPDMQGHNLRGEIDALPASDAYIAQKLCLEADELAFLRTTVLNEGKYPSVVRKQHVDSPPGRQRCLCDKCRPSTYW